MSTATFAATGDPTYVADQELSVSPRCIFSSSCVGELRNVGSLDQQKKFATDKVSFGNFDEIAKDPLYPLHQTLPLA